MLSMIIAMDENKMIGYKNGLPWNIPKDLSLFKHLTENNIVIMGNKTFKSIGKPLINRINIVLTKTNGLNNKENLFFFNNYSKAIEFALEFQNKLNKKIFIIGGKQIYEIFFPMIDELHLSTIKGTYKGDTSFNSLDLTSFKQIKSIDFKDFKYNLYIKNSCNK